MNVNSSFIPIILQPDCMDIVTFCRLNWWESIRYKVTLLLLRIYVLYEYTSLELLHESSENKIYLFLESYVCTSCWLSEVCDKNTSRVIFLQQNQWKIVYAYWKQDKTGARTEYSQWQLLRVLSKKTVFNCQQ